MMMIMFNYNCDDDELNVASLSVRRKVLERFLQTPATTDSWRFPTGSTFVAHAQGKACLALLLRAKNFMDDTP